MVLRALRRAWSNYVAGIPKSEVVDSIPESQWDDADLLPKVPAKKRRAFVELLRLLHAHLGAGRAAALVDAGAKRLVRGDEIDVALRDALLPEDAADGAVTANGFIAGDWRAIDDLGWQAAGLCRAHGVADAWAPPRAGTREALAQFGAWLAGRGLALFVVTLGDGVLAFAVAEASRQPVADRLRQLGIPSGTEG